MRLAFHRLHMFALALEYRLAAYTGNITVQQNMLEKTVLLSTTIRVEKEQYINRQLFDIGG